MRRTKSLDPGARPKQKRRRLSRLKRAREAPRRGLGSDPGRQVREEPPPVFFRVGGTAESA
jgi:hypothetical protein